MHLIGPCPPIPSNHLRPPFWLCLRPPYHAEHIGSRLRPSLMISCTMVPLQFYQVLDRAPRSDCPSVSSSFHTHMLVPFNILYFIFARTHSPHFIILFVTSFRCMSRSMLFDSISSPLSHFLIRVDSSQFVHFMLHLYCTVLYVWITGV